MFKLYDYQEKTKNELKEKLIEFGLVYLAAEERFGKNLTSMQTLEELECKNVLYVTVKNAIKGIQSDYQLGGFKFGMDVINYESVLKMNPKTKYDAIVFDESTKIASYPKPTNNIKMAYEMMKRHKPKYRILLNATPSVESYSQFFHQFKIIGLFPECKNFYVWFRKYGIPSTIRAAGGREIHSYKLTEEDEVLRSIEKYMITGTREDAGFEFTDAKINLHEVELDERSIKIYDKIKKDGIYEDIIADSAVKVMSKLQQLTGGFMYDEEGEAINFNYSKLHYIIKNFTGKKIAIYAKYTWEVETIKRMTRACTDPYDFKTNANKTLVQQIKSGSKGIDLSFCDQHWFYSLDFSGETFIQAIARQHNKKRDRPVEVEIVHTGLIDKDIYETVSNKKTFNSALFRSLE